MFGRPKPVAPVRERGLKYGIDHRNGYWKRVAPVRERGLKSDVRDYSSTGFACRSREGAWIEINGVLDYILKSELSLP